MPIQGDFSQLNLLMRRLAALPGATSEVLQETVPTIQALLHSATAPSEARPKGQEGPLLPGGAFRSSKERQGPLLASGRFASGGSVNPVAGVTWAGRRYHVNPATQARIDANTQIAVEGAAVRVHTGSDSPHLRPLVPVGELPPKWRAAISAKVNGGIRRRLKALKG